MPIWSRIINGLQWIGCAIPQYKSTQNGREAPSVELPAEVARGSGEMADALGLGPSGAIRGGSSPFSRTNFTFGVGRSRDGLRSGGIAVCDRSQLLQPIESRINLWTEAARKWRNLASWDPEPKIHCSCQRPKRSSEIPDFAVDWQTLQK